MLSAQDYLELSRVDSALFKNKVAEVHIKRKSTHKVEHPVQWEVVKYSNEGRLTRRETKMKGVPLNTADYTYNNGWLINMDRQTYHFSRSKEKEEWIGIREREKYDYNNTFDSVFVSKYILRATAMNLDEVLQPLGVKIIRYDSAGRIIYLHEKANESATYMQYKLTYDSLNKQTAFEYELGENDTLYFKLEILRTYIGSTQLKNLEIRMDKGEETREYWMYELNADGKILSGKSRDGARLKNTYYKNGLLKQSVIHQTAMIGWIRKRYVYRG